MSNRHSEAEFYYTEMFQHGADTIPYTRISSDFVRLLPFGDGEIVTIDPEGLTLLAERALTEVSFYLRSAHLERVASILKDPEASSNDRYVATALLRNSVIAAERRLPTCQDTGTAIVIAKRGERVFTGADDQEAISLGIYRAYSANNLRYSQVIPLSTYEEVNSGTNLPAQIDIYSTPGEEYRFLFLAKGGGSANKSFLYQETRALLDPEKLVKYLTEKIVGLGTSACPPYHLAIVLGGTSAEQTLKTVKLASAGELDDIPLSGDLGGRAFRDIELESFLLKAACESGIGAQFGGKYLAHDVRVIRLPRHGASFPVGLGVSCSADRNIRAKITREGLFIEELEKNPARFLPSSEESLADAVQIDLNRSMNEIRSTLAAHPVGTRLMLTGRLIVARDMAHAKFRGMVERGERLPDYFRDHPIYYAGPAKTPEGMATGSFGPTTAGRMDSYIPLFQERGYSLITIAKGNRSKVVTESCQRYGGFYLGSIGGPAALLAKENIVRSEVIDFPELGMEAVRAIDVVGFPAFIIVDDRGNDLYANL